MEEERRERRKEIEMKVIRPAFWKKFQCIGGGCTDNCCVGWEVDIDGETWEKYQRIPGELGERLRREIKIEEGEISFRMRGERCPFLNEENLCELICQLGEESLCEICTEHPRFYGWMGEWKEAGLGLCCEEAVRLLLDNPETLEFETVWEEGEETETDSSWILPLREAREALFSCLQDRRLPFFRRMERALLLGERLQECMDWEDYEEFSDEVQRARKEWAEQKGEEERSFREEQSWCAGYGKILQAFGRMEVMDERWTERLEKIREKLPTLYESLEEFESAEKSWSYEWEHLAVYILFRYFLKGAEDGDVLSKVRMAAAGCGVVRLLHLDTWERTGKLSLWDRICNVKAYSKELEYSEENLEMWMDFLWEGIENEYVPETV